VNTELFYRSNKYFSKKPIAQVAVVPEYSILIALTGELTSGSSGYGTIDNVPGFK
jgi:hypothetical protein